MMLLGLQCSLVVVSSAYRIAFDEKQSCRLLTYKLNSTKPRMDPCETPKRDCLVFEEFASKWTN